MSEFQRAAALVDLSVDGLLGVWVGDTPVLLTLVDGEVCAIDDICSHAHAHLSDGIRCGREVECALHGARFDLCSGAHRSFPAVTGVPRYEVKVEDGVIYVALD